MYEYIDVIIRRGRFKTVQFDCIRVFDYPGAFLVGLFLRNISNENLGEFFQKFTSNTQKKETRTLYVPK
jgi:hypothetical protein